MKILAMSVFCVDIYEKQNLVCVGGSSLNFAAQCAKSGADDISVLGAVGNDMNGMRVKNFFTRTKVDSTHLHIQKGKTARNRVYVNVKGERNLVSNSWDGGVYDTFRPDEDDWSLIAKNDLIATTMNEPSLLAILASRTQKNKLTVDFLDTRNFDLVEQILPKIDIAFLNGDAECVERLKPVSKKTNSFVVVTMGTEGSIALKSGSAYYLKAKPAEKVVDSTGCGDAYHAAFLTSYMQNGDIVTAMEHGTAAAESMASHYGGAVCS